MNKRSNTKGKSIRIFWLHFKENKSGVIGLIGLVIIVLVAVLAPVLTKYSYWQNTFPPNVAPCKEFLFGTDDLGRDVFTRTIYGTQVSLLVGVLASITSALIGILIGAVAGYLGGVVDLVLMKITELFQVIPSFFLAIVIAAFFGPSFFGIIIVIGVLSWPATARLVRAEFLTGKTQEFVQATISIGGKKSTIIFSEILPNALPQVIVNASLQAAAAILIEASLNFFGLGDPSRVSWGKMLFDAQSLIRSAPWTSIYPGLAILLTVLCINMFGDGLNDALNPKFRKR